VNPLLFEGVHEQERMVGANENLQLAQLVSRWWNPPEHDFRIGGGLGTVKLVCLTRQAWGLGTSWAGAPRAELTAGGAYLHSAAWQPWETS
jgi:hypothetical protein